MFSGELFFAVMINAAALGVVGIKPEGYLVKQRVHNLEIEDFQGSSG